MQTVSEFLAANFGESALKIEGVSGDMGWGKQTFERASFVLNNSRTFVSCGGKAIIAFDAKNRRPMYLVLDDTDGQKWYFMRRNLVAKHKAGGEKNDALTKEEWSMWHSSKPNDKMRLVQSA